ncbi:MAG: hypothetical protein KC501_11900 [Myxococcales bacterium]|nr:hypothetical protein [Myxococcales bacterium]
MLGAHRTIPGMLLVLALTGACRDDSLDVPDGGGDACGGACAPTSTTEAASGSGQVATGDGSTAAAGSTADPPPAGPCTCQLADLEAIGCGFEELAQWTPGCPADMPCGRVTVECMRPGQDLYGCMGQELAYDEAALQCALETLRDQAVARLEIDGREDYGIFSGQSRYVVHVLGEGAAVRAGCMSTDVGFEEYTPSSRQVLEAAHFEGCLALPTATERYDCLWEGLPVVEALPVCAG